MKAFITGATGFIGSHVAEKLVARNIEVRCLARKTSDLKWLKGLPVELVEGSLSSADSLLKAVEGCDIVYHIAGLTAARSEEEFLRGNRDGTRNLVDAVLKAAPGIQRFVHVSSLAAVGPATALSAPADEKTPLHPITAYGRSKAAAEEVVMSVRDRLPITIVRPPAVYGERDSAILTFFQSVAKGLVPLIGFSEKHVSLVHSDDLSRGIVEAGLSANTVGKSYFVSSDEYYTWTQIGKVTAEVMGLRSPLTIKLPHALVMGIAGISGFFGRFSAKPPVLDYEKGLDIIQDYWVCSTEAAHRDFGYRQQVSLRDGIRRTVEWYKQQGWL